jgi:flagellar biogenesis protein FliO
MVNVTGHRKKILIFLMASALGGGLLLIVSGQSARCSILDTGYSSRIENRESSIKNELFIKTMLAVLLVIILGVTAIYTSKKLLPKIAQGGALGWIGATLSGPDRKIHVLETAHLGPKKAVHLIEIGNHQYLVGSSNENITMLAELDTRCSMMDTRQESSAENQESRIENLRI